MYLHDFHLFGFNIFFDLDACLSRPMSSQFFLNPFNHITFLHWHSFSKLEDSLISDVWLYSCIIFDQYFQFMTINNVVVDVIAYSLWGNFHDIASMRVSAFDIIWVIHWSIYLVELVRLSLSLMKTIFLIRKVITIIIYWFICLVNLCLFLYLEWKFLAHQSSSLFLLIMVIFHLQFFIINLYFSKGIHAIFQAKYFLKFHPNWTYL